MHESPVHRPHPETPSTLALAAFEAAGAFVGLRAERFEVVSRGDFVPGVLYRPADCPSGSTSRSARAGAPTRLPLVVVQHGLGGSKESVYLDCAARWAREGFAVAAIDLPLHGARSSPKLSARLIEGIERIAGDQTLDAETHALVEEFARQGTSDLIRSVDALTAVAGIDASRIGYVGFSLGGIVGAYFLAHDPRPCAGVLALAGGGRGPADLDPAAVIGGAIARPLLVVAAEEDQRVAQASSRALFDAAREPKEFLVSPGEHGQLSGKTLGKIQTFLRDAFARQP